MGAGSASKQVDQTALLNALAHDLRLPLLQVKTKLEVLEQGSRPVATEDLAHLQASATAGLHQIEAYIFSLLPSDDQLQLAPLSLGALLDDVAHQIEPYATHYQTTLEVHQKYTKPVLAHTATVKLAFTCLAESLIRTQAAQAAQSDYRLTLGAHRVAGQIAAGVYGGLDGLSGRFLDSARKLAGRAAQPTSVAPPGSSAGILIADRLFAHFGLRLRPSHHEKQPGLAVNFQLSNQLVLL